MSIESDLNDSLSDDVRVGRKRCSKKQSLNERSDNKKKRYSGEPYTSSSGEEKPGKPFIIVLNCCKDECFKKIPVENQEMLHNQFLCESSKVQQDVLLSGLMQCNSASTHHVDVKIKRNNIWRYSVKINGSETVVCQKFLRGLYQISEKKLRIIQK